LLHYGANKVSYIIYLCHNTRVEHADKFEIGKNGFQLLNSCPVLNKKKLQFRNTTEGAVCAQHMHSNNTIYI